MKALENNLNAEAGILITYKADFKTLNSDGLSAVDFIFAKGVEHLKEVLRNIMGNQSFENLSKIYTEEKLTELRKLLNCCGNECLKVQDIDTLADTTMLSGMSEMMPSMEAIPREDKLGQKFKELQAKAAEAQKRVEKMRKRNRELKSKLQANTRSEQACLEKSKTDNDPMTTVTSTLTNEINCYTNWIDGYRRTSTPFFENIHELIANQIKAFFGKKVSVAQSGSYENGLIMPWSDLNLIVTFAYDAKSENRQRSYIIESTKKFSKVLRNEKSIIQSCTVEERNSLMILKLRLTKQFREQTVEVIFKYYVNPAYPSNEEIVNEYLNHYKVAKPLYIVFRTILHRAKLDDPSLNGLKSMVIFLMIVGYLQQLELTSGKSTDGISLGELFLNFLFFYSYGFDYYKESIWCYPANGKPALPFGPKDPNKKINSLMVLNPYNRDIILTKSFKRTPELKQLIKLCYISLFSRCACLSTKTLTIKPKLSLTSKKKNNKLDNSFDIFNNDVLDMYKSVGARYITQLFKKEAKRSLHLTPDSIPEITRASFAHQKIVIDEVFQAEMELYRPVSVQGMPMYMLQGLFNFNASPVSIS